MKAKLYGFLANCRIRVEKFSHCEFAFFARGISYRDIVKASALDNDFILDFKEVVERGGHSTYMLLFRPAETRVGSYWNMLERSGCSYESTSIKLSIGQRSLFSVDV